MSAMVLSTYIVREAKCFFRSFWKSLDQLPRLAGRSCVQSTAQFDMSVLVWHWMSSQNSLRSNTCIDFQNSWRLHREDWIHSQSSLSLATYMLTSQTMDLTLTHGHLRRAALASQLCSSSFQYRRLRKRSILKCWHRLGSDNNTEEDWLFPVQHELQQVSRLWLWWLFGSRLASRAVSNLVNSSQVIGIKDEIVVRSTGHETLSSLQIDNWHQWRSQASWKLIHFWLLCTTLGDDLFATCISSYQHCETCESVTDINNSRKVQTSRNSLNNIFSTSFITRKGMCSSFNLTKPQSISMISWSWSYTPFWDCWAGASSGSSAV